MLFLRYHPGTPETQSIPLLRPGTHEQNEEDILRPKHSMVLSIHGTLKTIVIIFGFFVFAVTIPFSIPGSHNDLGSAIVGGCILLILTMISIMLLPLHYIAQIRKTRRLKRAGSLNPTALCIQTVMWMIIPAHLFYEHRTHSLGTLLILGLIISMLPGSLLGLVVHYEYVLPRQQAKTPPAGFVALPNEEPPPPSYEDVEADRADAKGQVEEDIDYSSGQEFVCAR